MESASRGCPARKVHPFCSTSPNTSPSPPSAAGCAGRRTWWSRGTTGSASTRLTTTTRAIAARCTAPPCAAKNRREPAAPRPVSPSPFELGGQNNGRGRALYPIQRPDTIDDLVHLCDGGHGGHRDQVHIAAHRVQHAH